MMAREGEEWLMLLEPYPKVHRIRTDELEGLSVDCGPADMAECYQERLATIKDWKSL